ncbi:hypothetical protein [Corynebacterium argentoratense]|uniref:hypothetical protein n=1 Tax=Corynebacterium argentoratense TaxID=42817 RepID=UPI0028E1C753|nr:hypothetical protein [Corynebacterium argentoratense]
MMNKQTQATALKTVLPAEHWGETPKPVREVRTLYHATGRSDMAETPQSSRAMLTTSGSFVQRLVDRSSLLLSAIGFGGAVYYMLAGVLV